MNQAEPNPESKIPDCPDFLTPEAGEEWKRLAKQLFSLGLISDLDRVAFAAYCQNWARYVDAEKNITKYGSVTLGAPSENWPNGYPMQSPYLAVANQAQKEMRAFLLEFGMTPSSRTRIHGGVSVPPDADKVDDFLFGSTPARDDDEEEKKTRTNRVN